MPSSNGQYVGGVILLLLSTGSAVLSMDPLGVFAGCVESENIPQMTSENNTLLRTTFEIIQSANLSEAVLKCVSNKIGQLRNSSDTTEWFIAHTFDPMIVKKNIDHAVSVYLKDKDYSCLRSVATEQEQCFKNVTSLVQQTETTAENVCKFPLDQCMNYTRFENECRSGEIVIIEAATALFYGKCFTARKVQEYGKCVKDGLMAPQSPLDNALSHLLDGYHIGTAFQHYCTLKELVTSNFECTKNNLRSMCYGGVFDVIYKLISELNTEDFYKQCVTIKKSQSCRIRYQLTRCSQNYADGMEIFYNKLLSPACRAVSDGTPDVDYGDGYKCFHGLALEMEDIFKNISGVETFKTALITAMRTACSLKSQWMPCLRQAHKTSKKSFDKLIFEVIIPDNIEAVADFVCSKVDDFDKHGLCVLKAVDTVNQDNCGLRLAQKISPIFKSPADLPKKIPEFCGYLKPLATCGKQLLFDGCDANLADDAMTLGTMLDKSCHNPNPISNRSSGSIISAVIVFGMAVLVLLLDI